MMPFLIIIAVVVFALLFVWILDREKAKSYQEGFAAGKATNESNEQTFMRGVLWIQAADDAIEQERRDVLRRELEERWKKSGAA